MMRNGKHNMAATDQPYRNQKALDVVFAVSNILLLVSMIWMFVQDYNREWKGEQRAFRDVEAAMFARQAVYDLPDPDKYKAAQKAVSAAEEERKQTIQVKVNGAPKEVTRDQRIAQLDDEIRALRPKKEKAEAKAADVKSLLESRTSFLNIAVEARAQPEANAYRKEVNDLQQRLDTAQGEFEVVLAQMKDHQRERDQLDRPLTRARTELKRITDDLLRKARTAVKKEWGFGDWFRSLPIIDGFASPTKIHQFTLNELTIDYNFKNVTRFDRCMTCHQGIDRAPYTKDNLRALREVPEAMNEKLQKTREILKEMRATFAGTSDEKTIPQPDSLVLNKLPESELTAGRVTEFCAHPRLDLFVGSNSKHPAEKFGCTSCHAGQGSATDFYWATHTPNNAEQSKKWKAKYGWGSIHDWDFPMLPKRFVEASCLKCHHQVTDLVSDGNRHEAPKLLRGYNLIRENGCFGCHEIPGQKDGKPIGPDLRLEPYPALEQLPAGDRERILADKDTPPGNLRKVGPSLFRVREKTNEEWVGRWIKSPRSFRPDTRMPHFYGLSNNNKEALEGTGQEKFPDAEVAGITYYLFAESQKYLEDVAALQKDKVEGSKKDQADIDDLLAQMANRALMAGKTNAEKDEMKAKLEKAKVRLARRHVAPPIDFKAGIAAKHKGDAVKGRKLFTERGCLACHNHAGTTKAQGDEGEANFVAAAPSVAHFGPTLSQVKAKLGTKPGDMDSARTWLIHWITNPWAHSPRTRMPLTHLGDEEAADVAAWLLSQEPTELGSEWANVKVAAPEQTTLEELAKVYLVRILSRADLGRFFKDGLPKERIEELPQDEKDFATRLAGTQGKKRTDETLWYVGRKAVGRLGCFGCHDVPGFENTKSIGTALSDWGKKDPGRLAFENIDNYLKDSHFKVDDWHNLQAVAEKTKEEGAEGKTPYDGFFWEALTHRTREGYLYQKVKEPRSYDYKLARGGSTLAWDDRSRMPQFKFAHPHKYGPEGGEEFAARKTWQTALGKEVAPKRTAETATEFEARAAIEEADAREAVMTFVLGLVGEAMPSQYLNNPSPDRLAEVKGRQVLDKFNCAGCHNIRPGSFDFRVTDAAMKQLQYWRKLSKGSPATDFNFLEHNIWDGSRSPLKDVLTAHGVRVRPQLPVVKKTPTVLVTLTQALAFRDAKGHVQNIRGANTLGLLPQDMVFPPPEVFDSPEAMRAFANEEGQYGGRFADLLVKYLMAQYGKQYEEYPPGSGDSSRARAAAPPPLMNQGERTQPDWLFRFLRDPMRVRKLTVLRMPRFNLSEDDARALVNYFAAVDRINNPGIGLQHPYATVPQRTDLNDDFWRSRTAAYVQRLKSTPGPDKKSSYDLVAKELAPAFKLALKEGNEEADRVEARLKTAEAELKDEKKDEVKKKTLQEQVNYLSAEAKRLREAAKKTTEDSLRDEWLGAQAYAHAGYRVLTKVCASCHEVGRVQPSPDQLQGPSLNISGDRLRPEWLKRWIAHPQRYLPYSSSMSQNFPNTPDQPQFQQFIVGTPLEQVTGVRDTLMILPRIDALPVNRAWLLTGGVGEKK